jgi:hypothetical protein
VYAHIRRKRFRRNVRVGRLKGACRTTSKRVRLFNRRARAGVYRVQFDTFKRFRSRRVQRLNFRLTIFTTVRGASASGASTGTLTERWKLLDSPGGGGGFVAG